MKHLLREHGILTSFSIRQKITSDEMLQIYKEIEENSSTEKEIATKFHKIMEQKSLQNIPGAINPDQEQLRMQELFERASLLATFIQKDKDMTKKEMVIILHMISKHLGINFETND